METFNYFIKMLSKLWANNLKLCIQQAAKHLPLWSEQTEK
jgi:hypothetical protein